MEFFDEKNSFVVLWPIIYFNEDTYLHQDIKVGYLHLAGGFILIFS